MTTKVDREITLDDFLMGLLAGLARIGEDVISIEDDRFYSGVISAFDRLTAWAPEHAADVDFWVAQDPVYGDAPDIRDGLTRAVQRDLISLDNPSYVHFRIKISQTAAPRYMEDLPGGIALYEDLTKAFLEKYYARN